MTSKQNDLDQLRSAEDIAIDVLAWLAGEPDLMARFLALTGLTADTLRRASTDPAFFGGLLDFLMDHEPTLLAYCAARDRRPEDVARAHRVLAGPPGLDTNDL